MKLSTRGRYAVMAMVDLALKTQAIEGRGPVTLAEIAERQAISLSYLEQLFSQLRRAGVVISARGPGGGYRLARAPAAISVADIVLAVDEPLHTTRCKPSATKGCMPDGSRCLTHDLWEALGASIRDFLSRVSLDDVCAHRLPGPAAAQSADEGAKPPAEAAAEAAPKSPAEAAE